MTSPSPILKPLSSISTLWTVAFTPWKGVTLTSRPSSWTSFWPGVMSDGTKSTSTPFASAVKTWGTVRSTVFAVSWNEPLSDGPFSVYLPVNPATLFAGSPVIEAESPPPTSRFAEVAETSTSPDQPSAVWTRPPASGKEMVTPSAVRKPPSEASSSVTDAWVWPVSRRWTISWARSVEPARSARASRASKAGEEQVRRMYARRRRAAISAAFRAALALRFDGRRSLGPNMRLLPGVAGRSRDRDRPPPVPARFRRAAR